MYKALKKTLIRKEFFHECNRDHLQGEQDN